MEIVGLIQILDLLKGIFQFPATMLEFLKLLRKTPQENHEGILRRIADEAKHFEDTGRPQW